MGIDRPSPPIGVLLVEDDELLRECLDEILADAGCDVAAAASAGQALQMVGANGAPDVLITDLHLDFEMNGPALIATARRRWPQVRAVLMSGADNVGSPLASGDRFLRKPFHPDALIRLVAELVEDRPR